MACVACNCKEMNKALEDLPITWEGHSVLIEEVPAFKCEDCGEVYFNSHIVRLTQKMAKAFSENPKLQDINKINISNVLDILNSERAQDCFYEALIENRLVPVLTDEKYSFSRDALLSIIKSDYIKEYLL